MKIRKVRRVLTLSLYNAGRHHFDSEGRGSPSFAESLVPIHEMLEEMYAQGVKLGTKIKVTMKVDKSEEKPCISG